LDTKETDHGLIKTEPKRLRRPAKLVDSLSDLDLGGYCHLDTFNHSHDLCLQIIKDCAILPGLKAKNILERGYTLFSLKLSRLRGYNQPQDCLKKGKIRCKALDLLGGASRYRSCSSRLLHSAA